MKDLHQRINPPSPPPLEEIDKGWGWKRRDTPGLRELDQATIAAALATALFALALVCIVYAADPAGMRHALTCLRMDVLSKGFCLE